MIKIAWGITGCGDLIEETFESMEHIKENHAVDITVYLSKNGEMVVKMYKLWNRLKAIDPKPKTEVGPNAPFLTGKLQTGQFDIFIVSPMSANTTAKIAHGIADSLLSNCVAQSVKAKVPTICYPADQHKGSIETILPNGKKLILYMRDIDVENSNKLKKMEGLTVLENVKDIRDVVK
ncbi:MAG: archaeoflavoprotein AfpA [Methanosarcinaceae archaeon]|jgi:archaeoflavoprotein AfpA|nr:archaeoflavoprotein AfpA [Methanosarcinaceae archaeon]NKQ39396.1 archaeoflavoprotein AfpA [Methanosarcinales archaeon]